MSDLTPPPVPPAGGPAPAGEPGPYGAPNPYAAPVGAPGYPQAPDSAPPVGVPVPPSPPAYAAPTGIPSPYDAPAAAGYAAPANQWAQYPPQPLAAARPLRGIATAVRWLIIASAVGSLITVVVEAIGISAIGSFLNGSGGYEALETYSALSLPVALLSTAVLIAAGVCWVVWQYRAASSIPANELQRSPGWHVGSWFIPVVSLWFPVQNVSDIIRGSRAAVGPGIVAAWWATWIAGNVSYTIATRVATSADSLEQLSASASFSIIGEVVLIAAAVFAWIIVGRITDALDPVRR